ncbi:MAG: enoyl-CoA hydratase-related protein [Proteobacteria bacterium]|nr:enoyl-CoA hydratase-related protein [Pseudomonadota bacterium]
MADYQPDTDQVLVKRDHQVVTLTLNRPEARNALSDELTMALRGAIAWAAADDSVRAVVLTGAGGAFCAGGDDKAMGRRSEISPPSLQAQYQAMVARHQELSGALVAMRKPTIAALPGPAAGAGMALALACDLRIAADTAFLSTAYVRDGLSGDYGIAWLLSRIVGPGRARELMLTGDRVQAAEALAMGLVNRVAAAEKLASATMELATQLASGPPTAMAYMKDNLDEALSVDHRTAIEREADRLLKSRSTADHREAVRAFAEKRAPVFTGE